MIKITKEQAEKIAKESAERYPDRMVKVATRVRNGKTFYAVKIF